jgi:hypothetical protein
MGMHAFACEVAGSKIDHRMVAKQLPSEHQDTQSWELGLPEKPLQCCDHHTLLLVNKRRSRSRPWLL